MCTGYGEYWKRRIEDDPQVPNFSGQVDKAYQDAVSFSYSGVEEW